MKTKMETYDKETKPEKIFREPSIFGESDFDDDFRQKHGGRFVPAGVTFAPPIKQQPLPKTSKDFSTKISEISF